MWFPNLTKWLAWYIMNVLFFITLYCDAVIICIANWKWKKKSKISNMVFFFYLIKMLSPDACFRCEYFESGDRVNGGLIGVSLVIISWQLGSNGSTIWLQFLKEKGKKKQADFWKKINHFELIYRILPQHKNVNY